MQKQIVQDVFVDHLDLNIIAIHTENDSVLKLVLRFTKEGWPEDLPAITRSDQNLELHVQHGVLMLGDRIVVPLKCREPVMRMLHETHIGETRMKAVARH